jgi:hypothetical protein
MVWYQSGTDAILVLRLVLSTTEPFRPYEALTITAS